MLSPGLRSAQWSAAQSPAPPAPRIRTSVSTVSTLELRAHVQEDDAEWRATGREHGLDLHVSGVNHRHRVQPFDGDVGVLAVRAEGDVAGLGPYLDALDLPEGWVGLHDEDEV